MNFTYYISVLVQNIIEVKSLLFAQYLEWSCLSSCGGRFFCIGGWPSAV